jgi:hypothetical protein
MSSVASYENAVSLPLASITYSIGELPSSVGVKVSLYVVGVSPIVGGDQKYLIASGCVQNASPATGVPTDRTVASEKETDVLHDCPLSALASMLAL